MDDVLSGRNICVRYTLDLKCGLFGDWLNGRVLVSGARDSGFNSRVPDQNRSISSTY